jgi:hypothetical protein
MSIANPRCSSARISCAMKVSDERIAFEDEDQAGH